MFLCLLLCLWLGNVASSNDYPQIGILDWSLPPECYDGPKGRVPWIIHNRQPDYGWKEYTHRANIALAVNGYSGTADEMGKMQLQLEVEITKALLRNSTSPIYDSDLALFIHALIATNKNPRNFHGIDLVADLLHRVNNASDVNPFLILALCNSNAIEFNHLIKLKEFTAHQNGESRHEIEMKALALKAFACAVSLGPQNSQLNAYKFNKDMKSAAECLRAKQNKQDGSFGNVYTSSLAFQALIAYGKDTTWNETSGNLFLQKESVIDVNMVKAYYIEVALNSRRVKFIKDLYKGEITDPGTRESTPTNNVQYTVLSNLNPDTHFTVTTKVPVGSNFFNVMERVSRLSERFQFVYRMSKDNHPLVYSVDGIPNDAEENMFWRICIQQRNESFVSETFNESPAKLTTRDDQHIIMWYRDSDCPTSPDPPLQK